MTAAGRAEGLEKALRELISIVQIHSSETSNNFAWAEMLYASEVLDGVQSALRAEPASQLDAPAPPEVAVEQKLNRLQYKRADGKFMDAQGWHLDNDDDDVGSFASAPIYLDGKPVALVFSDSIDFRKEIEDVCKLLCAVPVAAGLPAAMRVMSSRQAFEAWIRTTSEWEADSDDFTLNEGGDYDDMRWRNAYRAWEARALFLSAAAPVLPVEVPSQPQDQSSPTRA